MKINSIQQNNTPNFKAHIVLNDSPQLLSLINESKFAVGEKKLLTKLKRFKKFEEATPIKIAIENFYSFGNKYKLLVATNLKNQQTYKKEITEKSHGIFYDFISDLIDPFNYLITDFWSKPAPEETKKTSILDNDVFIKEEEFDIDEYYKNFDKKEMETVELEERFFKDLFIQLNKNEELRNLIYSIVYSKTPKPITKEDILRYQKSFINLTKSLEGKGWL